MLTFGLSATEASGDALGALLLERLGERMPDASFYGLGLEQMHKAGLESVWSGEDIAVMGYWDALTKFGRIMEVRKRLLARLKSSPPNLFVGIDSPDFNFGIERRMRRLGTKAAHIVSPSLWAWRPERIHKIRECVDLMLCLFPFERKIYEDAGIPAVTVGHPDADTIPDDPDRHEARHRLGVDEECEYVVTLMPGSRQQELANHTDLFIQSAECIASRHANMTFLVPAVDESCRLFIENRISALGVQKHQILVKEGAWRDCLAAANAAVIKSGTSTLQAMLYGVPMVIVYKMSVLSHWMLRLRDFHSDFIGLPNILAGRMICRELIQDHATNENITGEIEKLLSVSEARKDFQKCAMDVKSSLRLNATERMAEALFDLAGQS